MTQELRAIYALFAVQAGLGIADAFRLVTEMWERDNNSSLSVEAFAEAIFEEAKKPPPAVTPWMESRPRQ